MRPSFCVALEAGSYNPWTKISLFYYNIQMTAGFLRNFKIISYTIISSLDQSEQELYQRKVLFRSLIGTHPVL